MSRPLPASLLPVVGYLIRLLASRKDAEVIGAARAIGRQLTAAGLGFDDLAAHVERATAKPADAPRRPCPPPRPRSRRAQAWTPPRYVILDDGERDALLATLAEALADPRARYFDRLDMVTLVHRLERLRLPPTEKMLKRAERVVAALREGAA